MRREWMFIEGSTGAGRISLRAWEDSTELVLYEGGAQRVPLSVAMEMSPEAYCAEYIPPLEPTIAVVWRYLQVGKRRWWLEYRNPSGWRAEDGTARILGEEPEAYHPAFPHPMFSLDFVPGQYLYAIGMHTAPRLAGTGIEKLLEPAQVVELLGQAMAR